MKYACPRLLVALIISYKRSTHANKRRRPSPKAKNWKETKEKQNSRERSRAAPEEKMQRSIENQSFLFFSYFLFIHGHLSDG